MADNYAIVESGGKQYRAEKGTTLVVDRIKADEGEKVNLRAVMFRGDDDVVTRRRRSREGQGRGDLTGHERGEKIRVFKYKAKKGYRKRQGHRSELTRLEVTEVKMLTRKPAGRGEGRSRRQQARCRDRGSRGRGAEARGGKKPAPKKPAAAKKPAAKKPAAKKPAAKKPAAKKTDEKES